MTTKPLLVVVDDTDPRIKYTKGWFKDSGSQDKFGNYGPTYLHTQHGISKNGSFTFNFTGNYVKVYGTTNYVNTGKTAFDPILSCTVDGMNLYTVPPLTVPVNNQVLCTNETLPDGPHQLTVNVASRGQTFWFDYVRFQPSTNANASDIQNETLFIDDRYSSISYSDGWSLLNDSLAHYTQKKGATMKFNFNGTGITWYSQIPQGYALDSTLASYSIDGKNPATFSIVGPPDNSTKSYYQPLFSASGLRSGSHSLSVTYQRDNKHAPLTLDYLIVDPNSGASASKPKGKSAIGAIVGGVIGGVAFLVIVGLLVFFLLRRRYPRRRSSRLSIVPLDPPLSPVTTPHSDHLGRVEAFIDPSVMCQTYSTSGSHHSPTGIVSGGSRSSEAPPHTDYSYTQVSGRDDFSSGEMSTSLPSKSSAAVPSSVAKEIHHEDSGLRILQPNDEPVVEFPPSYTPR